MTLQDDIARPWFQPAVPTGAPQERARPDAGAQHDAGLQNNAGQRHGGAGRRDGAVPATDGGYAGGLTTRVAGELPLDEPRAPVPRSPSAPPMPERVEVTQPYIPAIREHEPSFAKRPHTEAPGSAAPAAPVAPAAMPGAPAHTPAPADPPPQVTGPGAVTAPTDLVTAPRKETSAEEAPARQNPTNPPKRRSLARRVVRKIIGPDLLRKDPVVKKK